MTTHAWVVFGVGTLIGCGILSAVVLLAHFERARRAAKRENARLTDELLRAQQSKTGACWAAYCRGVGFGYELAHGPTDPSLHSASYATIDELIGRHTVEES